MHFGSGLAGVGTVLLVVLQALVAGAVERQSLNLSEFERQPASMPASILDGSATLQHDGWGYLLTPEDQPDVELEATLTIDEPAQRLSSLECRGYEKLSSRRLESPGMDTTHPVQSHFSLRSLEANEADRSQI
jgi:hypothetical protein